MAWQNFLFLSNFIDNYVSVIISFCVLNLTHTGGRNELKQKDPIEVRQICEMFSSATLFQGFGRF